MIVRRKRRLREAWSILSPLVFVIGLLGPAAPASAAESGPGPATTPGAPFKPARPYWIELTVAQRQALAPLADDWERLDFQTKKKWVEIGNRYPRMNPDEQARTQQRMREWAMLTPDQRRVARDSFARIRAMNPEQRADLLRKYRELSPEKQRALAIENRVNKQIVVPKAMTTPVPRRTQISEGAKARNPAIAAQKGANPLVAPAIPAVRPVPVPPAPVAAQPLPAPAVPVVPSPAAVPPAAALPSAPSAAPPVKPATP